MRLKYTPVLIFCFGIALVLAVLARQTAASSGAPGVLVWGRRYDRARTSDYANAVAVDGRGNVYVAGHTWGGSSSYDYSVVKYGPNGEQLWTATYNGPVNDADSAYAVAVDGDGNVYVTGESVGFVTQYDALFDFATIKYDADGNRLWVARFNGPGGGHDRPVGIGIDGAGNVYVAGTSDGARGTDYIAVSYEGTGGERWVRRYDGPTGYSDDAVGMTVDARANLYVTGFSLGETGYYDYATVKYDTAGNEAWVRRHGGTARWTDIAYSVTTDSSGNVYVTGTTDETASGKDYTTIKYDEAGNELWVRRFDSASGTDGGQDVTVDAAGRVVVTGYSGPGNDSDYGTVAYDADGNQLWVARYAGPGGGWDAPVAVETDAFGNIFVTGYSTGSGTGYDFATLKYDADGREVWQLRYDGGGIFDRPAALAVDDRGHAYVAGTSAGLSRQPEDFATMKYGELPAAPSELSAVPESPVRIRLSWKDNSHNELRFSIERREGAESFAFLRVVPGDTTSVVDTSVQPSRTYTYRVQARVEGGGSEYAGDATATTPAEPPAPPEDLTAAAAFARRIRLRWRDGSSDETGFRIERAREDSDFSEVSSTGADVTSFTDQGLEPATRYRYRVTAFNSGGASPASAIAEATTFTSPAPPSGLKAEPVLSTRVRLTWAETTSEIAGYRLERSDGSGSFREVRVLPAGSAAFTDVNLTPGTEYRYRLRAFDSGDYSAYSNEAAATTLSPPGAPSGLTVNVVGATRLRLTWQDNSSGESGFRIERKPGLPSGPGPYRDLRVVGPDVTAFTDVGLEVGTTYTYRVRGYGAGGFSAYTGEVTATTQVPPAAPSELSVVAVLPTRTRLTWRDNSTDETGFRIERRLGDGPYRDIRMTSPNATAFTDIGLEPGTTYTYRVRAYGAGGFSAYTAERTVTMPR